VNDRIDDREPLRPVEVSHGVTEKLYDLEIGSCAVVMMSGRPWAGDSGCGGWGTPDRESGKGRLEVSNSKRTVLV